jgi:hypothetical protein
LQYELIWRQLPAPYLFAFLSCQVGGCFWIWALAEVAISNALTKTHVLMIILSLFVDGLVGPTIRALPVAC